MNSDRVGKLAKSIVAMPLMFVARLVAVAVFLLGFTLYTIAAGLADLVRGEDPK